MNFLKFYFVTLLILLVFDIAWIGYAAKNFYKEQFGLLMRKDINMLAAAICYAIIGLALTHFAVKPSIDLGSSAIATMNGAIFGFASYAIYNLTNYATIEGWTLKMVLVDTSWGTLVCTASSILSNKIIKILGLGF
jgi:uncharacterized membrane protein